MIVDIPPPPPSAKGSNLADSSSVTDWTERQGANNLTTTQFPSSIRESVGDIDGLIHKADNAIARRREELRNLQLQRQVRMAQTNSVIDHRSTSVNATIGRSANLLARAQAVVPGFKPTISTTAAMAKDTAMDTASNYSTTSSNVSSLAKTSLPGKITLTRTALIAKAEAAVASASVHLGNRTLPMNGHGTGDIRVPTDSSKVESSPPLGATTHPRASIFETDSVVLDVDEKCAMKNISSPPISNLSAQRQQYVDTPIDRNLLRASHDFVNEKTPDDTHHMVAVLNSSSNESLIAENASKKQILEAMRDAASTPPFEKETHSSNNSLFDARMENNHALQVETSTEIEPTLSQPSSTPTLRMVKELNRIQQEYTSVMKRNLQLEKEVEQLRQVVVEEDRRKDKKTSEPLPPTSSHGHESEDSSITIDRQRFLQHFLSYLVGKATEQGDSAAVRWAQSQISSAASMDMLMKQHNYSALIPSSSSVTGINMSSPTRVRGRAIGSPSKHSSISKNRMKSPQPKGRQRTTWKEYIDDGERDTAMRALQAVSIEYTSDLATYVIRKPHGGNLSLISETSDDDFGGQVHWIRSVHEYIENSTVDDPSTLEVMAFIHDDSSILFVQQHCYAKHGIKCIGDENNFEWKTYENFESDDLLGSVVYIDVHGNEQEYLLDVILNEAYDIRERYCSSVLSAAAALSISKAHGLVQPYVAPISFITEERAMNIPVPQESVPSLSTDTNSVVSLTEPPLNPSLESNQESSEKLASFPLQCPEPNMPRDVADHIQTDYSLDLSTSNQDRTMQLPSRVPSTIGLSTSAPPMVPQTQVTIQVDSKHTVTNQISSPLISKVEPMRVDVVTAENRSSSIHVVSTCIFFVIMLPSRILLFFFIRLPWMILKGIICSALFVVFLSLLWLCLSNDNGAMKMGAGVNFKFVPPSVFDRGL